MESDLLLTVYCAAYNQAPYIRQTLDGFLAQKTNFKFKIVIHDDASTDGTDVIIQEYAKLYPDIISAIFESENQWSKHDNTLPKLMYAHAHGKYLAFCEGDDVWTDPMKLQKQVDFFEDHPEYTLLCHNWNVFDGNSYSDSPIHHLYKQPFTFTFDTLPWVWITKTLTVMIRRDAINVEDLLQYKLCRDVHSVYYALKSGKGYYMPAVMATYRVHDGGVWSKHDSNERNKTTYDLYKELYQHEPNKAVRKRYMNATLAYFNGLAFGKTTWWHFGTNAKLYFEALRNVSGFKDIVFCLGGLVPTSLVKWVMKTFKV